MSHDCPRHGPMKKRDENLMTEEQRWCGEWWDCERCTHSDLIPSAELNRSFGAYLQREAQREMFAREEPRP